MIDMRSGVRLRPVILLPAAFILLAALFLGATCGGDKSEPDGVDKGIADSGSNSSTEEAMDGDEEATDIVPVIFIPGITASILKSENNGDILWPPGGLEIDPKYHLPTVADALI